MIPLSSLRPLRLCVENPLPQEGPITTKIVLIGAGSVSFGTGTLCDLFGAHEALRGSIKPVERTNVSA